MRRILVVDDNREIHNDFNKVLSLGRRSGDGELDSLESELFGESSAPTTTADPAFDVEIDSAFQGEQGIEMARAASRQGQPYFLAFIDGRMPPGIDGVQTIKRLWLEQPDLQCVFCTAYSDYEWDEIGHELGESRNLLILKKPFDAVEVLQIVKSLSEKTELAERTAQQRQQLEDQLAELGRAERELRDNNKALTTARELADQANAAKTEFLAKMSHELRTPLVAVTGMAELLSYTELDAHQHEYVHTISSSASALLELVNEILDYSKVSANKLKLENIEFDVQDLIESTVRELGPRCCQKGLELPCYIDPSLPQLMQGDPTRIRQVITNLLNNAIKFTETGSVTLEASRCESPAGESQFQVSITDTGIGIPEDRRECLFEAFAQVDASTTRKFGGTGLGLAICKQIVDMMGGEIDFTSELGHGSRFWFSLPLNSNQPASPVEENQQKVRGMRLLVIEPDEASRKSLQRQLVSWGCDVVVAEDGDRGRRSCSGLAASGGRLDAILLSANLPPDQPDFASKLAQQCSLPETPQLILMVPLDSAAAAPSGLHPQITKPILPSRLLPCLNSLERPAAGGAAAKVPQPVKQGFPATNYPDAKILLAEDNRATQRAFVAYLTHCGYNCEVANNGVEVVELLERGAYELVLMDVQMPKMDGIEATRRIREGGQGLPIIALTAGGPGCDRQDCQDAGMDDYLSKPLNLRMLFQTVDSWLQRLEEGLAESGGQASDVAVRVSK